MYDACYTCVLNSLSPCEFGAGHLLGCIVWFIVVVPSTLGKKGLQIIELCWCSSELSFSWCPSCKTPLSCCPAVLQGSVCQTAILCLSGLTAWLCKSNEASDYSLMGW